MPIDGPDTQPSTHDAVREAVRERYGDDIFSHLRQDEVTRLNALADELDPATRTRLAALGIKPDWRCLELGAGTGTIARWLSEQCPDGSVLATDLDLRYLTDLTAHNLQARRHDVTSEDMPPASFDLIHARYLFSHISERQRVLTRVSEWLAPGGLLILEEPALFPIEVSANPLYRRVSMGVFAVLADRIGTDCRWAPQLPQVLSRAGLTRIGLDLAGSLVGAGRPMSRFWQLTIAQVDSLIVAGGHASMDDVHTVMSQLDADDFHDFGMATIAAWGQRPD